jgi:hypothetical protein
MDTKRDSINTDAMQEFMEDYIPQFVPARIRHHIDYFFDIMTPKKNGLSPSPAFD